MEYLGVLAFVIVLCWTGTYLAADDADFECGRSAGTIFAGGEVRWQYGIFGCVGICYSAVLYVIS